VTAVALVTSHIDKLSIGRHTHSCLRKCHFHTSDAYGKYGKGMRIMLAY